MRKRRMIVGLAALLALVAVVRHPTADIAILTHKSCDPSPHKFQAAVDLGVVAVKFLLTWTAEKAAAR